MVKALHRGPSERKSLAFSWIGMSAAQAGLAWGTPTVINQALRQTACENSGYTELMPHLVTRLQEPWRRLRAWSTRRAICTSRMEC